MTTSEKCFITVAQTLHMGKAAELLFTSQQAVSDNIRRLEREHCTQLFFRRPHLSLTPEGRILLKALERIRIIEDNLQKDIQHIYNNTSGTIRFGVGSYRVHDAVVNLLVKYHQMYPDIRIDVLYEDTTKLESMLLQGQLDVFAGFNISNNEDFCKSILIREDPCVLITESLLQMYLLPEDIATMKKQGINIEQFEKLPLIANYPDGSLWKNYQYAFDRLNIHPHIIASSNDFSEIIKLCSASYGVALCPSFLHSVVDSLNATDNRFNRIYTFPFPDLGWVNSIELATHKMSSIPHYLRDFINIAGLYMAVQNTEIA